MTNFIDKLFEIHPWRHDPDISEGNLDLWEAIGSIQSALRYINEGGGIGTSMVGDLSNVINAGTIDMLKVWGAARIYPSFILLDKKVDEQQIPSLVTNLYSVSGLHTSQTNIILYEQSQAPSRHGNELHFMDARLLAITLADWEKTSW